MRRISLALALIGAVAAAGCSGGGNSTASGEKRGSPGSSYTVEVRVSVGGAIESGALDTGTGVFTADGLIRCGNIGSACTATFPWDPITATTEVGTSARVLRATAESGKILEAWAGDCSGGDQYCVLAGNADKFVAARFGTIGAVTGHPNWSDPAVHAAQYRSFALQCNRCHGLDWNGQAIAPSCYTCHNLDAISVLDPEAVTTPGHFDPGGALSSHNSKGCGRCHRGGGFLDYIGADGTASNVVDGTFSPDGSSFAIGPMTCKVCHNSVSDPFYGTLRQHMFPLKNVVNTDASTAICSQCHDGGRSGYTVAALMAAAPETITTVDEQLPSTTNKVVRAHYLPAASTLFGAEAANYYQYPGKIYTARNQHGGKGSCTSCHNPHDGSLPADADVAAKCGECHFNEAGASVATFLELEESRQFGFEGDIDGDAIEESLKLEIDGLAAVMYSAMREYATNVAQLNICAYDNRYYVDDGAGGGIANNGICETGETTEFKKFTPRLLRAAYNYLIWQNDSGAWAHNPRYAIEVLFDTIEDLNAGLVAGGFTAVTNGKRAFNGHFGAAEDASPYAAMVYHATAPQGFTSAACYQCHGGQGGFEAYLASAPAALADSAKANKVTAMQCSTCHTFGADMKGVRSDVTTLYFPPQKGSSATSIAADTLPANSANFMLCGTCHSGRENGTSVDSSIAANFALSKTNLSVTAFDPTDAGTITVASTGWKANTYQFARVSFTSGVNAGTSVIVKSSTATAGGSSKLLLATAPGTAPVAGDTFDLTFDGDTWGVGFTNPHYLGAAGVLVGSNGHMLYEYEGQSYAGYPINWGSPHGSPHGASCTGCHQPKASKHTFEIDEATLTGYCGGCHAGAYALEPKKLEAEEAAAELYAAITSYAAGKGVALCYNGASHPYWFADDGSDGTCSTTVQAKLDAKTAKAAFNYKWSQAEPGAFAHNLEYMLQALYDSTVDLGGTPTYARPVTE